MIDLDIYVIWNIFPKKYFGKETNGDSKKVIIDDFVNDPTIDELSKKFTCTKITIIRNLKKNIPAREYNSILNKNKTSQINPSETKITTKHLVSNYKENNELKNEAENLVENISKEIDNYEIFADSTFMEIAPLDCEINNETQKDLSSISIMEIDFPKIVYDSR